MNKIILFILLSCICLNLKTSAQAITYTISENLAICEQSLVTFDVTNTGSTVLNGPEILIDLPCGFIYNPSSVTNAIQKNISDPNKPVFTLNNIGGGQKYTFTIIASIGCDAVTCVNGLQVFNIKATFTANNITTESTSLPFNVQAANLVITRIENPYTEAEFNDIATRKITVKNARLGKLAQFKYKNNHDGNVDINIEGGTFITKTTKVIEHVFDAIDFRKIGNKDDFLDFNEEIVVVERIKITNCSFENQFNNATFNISWGCNDVICQSVQANATIKIIPSKDRGPKLNIRTTYTDPECYFPGMSLQRIDILESFHKNALLAFELEIKQTQGNRGIKVGSLTAPFTNDIQYKGLFTNECGESLARVAIIKVPRLEPITTQKISTITWQTAFCEQVGCDPKRNAWTYKFNYVKECSEFNDREFVGKGVSADSTRSALETFFLLDSLTTPAADMDTVMAKYTVFNERLKQNQGIISILFEFPAILRLLNTDFSLGGKLPFAIDTINANGRVQIKLSYNLPLSAKDLEMFIPFIVDCDEEILVDPCVEKPYSSCTFFCDLDVNSNFISSITTLAFGGACPAEGILKSCVGSSFATYCKNNNICFDTIPGFYDYRFNFFRTNYGIPDRDNNGFPDANNVINPSTLLLREFMPGDTMKMVFDGIIKVDIPGSTFTNLNILLQQLEFLSSSPANTALMENLLFGEEKAFKQFSSTLRIYDKSENRYYTLVNIMASISDTYTNYDLSTSSLRILDATFPEDFKYQEGDSIYLEINNRLDLNVFRGNKNDLAFQQYVTYRYETNTVLDNRPWNDESVFSICNCFEGVVRIAGFNLTAPVLSSLIFNEPEICDGAVYNNLVFVMNIGHDLKSTDEIREVARPTGLRITKMPDFDFETLTVEFRSKFYTFEPTLISPMNTFMISQETSRMQALFREINIDFQLSEYLRSVYPK